MEELMIDHTQAIQILKTMLVYERRGYERAQSKRRRMRPSERAMTLAHYAMNIEALEFAITNLEATKPLQSKLVEMLANDQT